MIEKAIVAFWAALWFGAGFVWGRAYERYRKGVKKR